MTKLRISLALPVVLALGCADVPDAPRATSAPTTTTPAAAPTAAAESLPVDAASSRVAFTGAKITRTHEGGFREFTGTITYDAAEPLRSRVEMRVATASLFADDPRLTEHLKSPDFFDVARLPEATFRSTSLAAGGTDGATHTITGELTIHGVTKTVSFPISVQATTDAVTANAEFTIDRRDYGIVFPGMPDDLIRNDVVLHVSLRAPRAPRAPS